MSRLVDTDSPRTPRPDTSRLRALLLLLSAFAVPFTCASLPVWKEIGGVVYPGTLNFSNAPTNAIIFGSTQQMCFNGAGVNCLTHGGTNLIQTTTGVGIAMLGASQVQSTLAIWDAISNPQANSANCSGHTDDVCINDDLAGANAGTTTWNVSKEGAADFTTFTIGSGGTATKLVECSVLLDPGTITAGTETLTAGHTCTGAVAGPCFMTVSSPVSLVAAGFSTQCFGASGTFSILFICNSTVDCSTGGSLTYTAFIMAP